VPFFVHRVVGSETQLQRVRGDTLLIGRGTGAHLRFPDDAAVELEHAVIRQDPKGFLLHDEGSVTGTYLNGRAIETARLSNEDRIEIGRYLLRVQISHPDDPLFLHVRPMAAAVAPAPAPPPAAVDVSTRKVTPEALPAAGGEPTRPRPGPPPPPPVRRLDFAAAYRLRRSWVSKGSLSWLGLGAAAAVAFFAAAGDTAAPRPGPVSDAHANVGLGADCAACHAPWQGPAPARCERCHAGPRHQPEQAFDPPCGGCHSEHRRLPRLTAVGDAACLTCHRDLTLRDGGEPRVARRIDSFDDHPDFRLPADPDPLRLNHALHLKAGLRGPKGPAQLDCASCHVFDPESGTILPIRYEQHCQSCHDLAFDDRFPDTQAPHGPPAEVLRGIFGAYSQGRDALAGLSNEQIRGLIFSGRGGGLSFDERTRRQAFTAAEHVFRFRCTVCHVMEVRSVAEVRVEKPVIPTRWFTSARFSHRPHRQIPCTDCHGKAPASRATSDVLIPGISACVRCHGSGEAAVAPEERVPTGCVTCHTYHEKTAEGWKATLAGTLPGRAPEREPQPPPPAAGEPTRR
jgi:FHA domain/Cytochrome c7 and related cytochrome c